LVVDTESFIKTRYSGTLPYAYSVSVGYQDIIDTFPSNPFYIDSAEMFKIYLVTPLVAADTNFTFYVFGGESDLYKFQCEVK